MMLGQGESLFALRPVARRGPAGERADRLPDVQAPHREEEIERLRSLGYVQWLLARGRGRHAVRR